MRRTGLLLGAGVIGAVAVAVLSMGAVAPVSSPEPSEIEQLRNEVAALRQRVEALEKRLNEKDASLPLLPKAGKGRPDIIDPYHGLRQTPPGWQPREFNGVPYYIVPIQKSQRSTCEANKQAPPDKAPAAPEAAPGAADNR
jgi:hypothetical protein